MTIAIGILANDGVVIAADTEETLGEIIKYSVNKVSGAYRFSKTGYPRSMVMAGSGHGHYIDAFSDVLKGVVNSDDPALDKNPHEVLDSALERFYVRKVVPLMRLPMEERPEFRVVIGLIAGGKSHLFVSDGATLRREEHFAVVGAGGLIAKPLLSAYVGYQGSRAMSVREAAIAAAHAAYEAKSVTGVGGDTDVLAMFDQGKHARIVPPDYEPLDRLFKHYSSVLRPAVLRSVIGIQPSERIAKEIERLRDGFRSVVGDRFDPPSPQVVATNPVKQAVPKSPKRGRKPRPPSQA